ncbi:hypothetical protein [Nocardia sp. bgisy134]|uniref:hypothetical protein n=1 Tax=Nocardia sp. bgisy134 TaxID=3413789 RepID=UPI003D7431F6
MISAVAVRYDLWRSNHVCRRSIRLGEIICHGGRASRFAAAAEPIATNPAAQNSDPIQNGAAAGAGVGAVVGAITGLPGILAFGVGALLSVPLGAITGAIGGAVIGAIVGAVAPDVVPQVLP